MASIFLGDLDDFIAPSQACINPIVLAKKDNLERNEHSDIQQQGGASIVLSTKFDDIFETEINLQSKNTQNIFQPLKPANLIKTTQNNTATVSLSDCLACSGCVTSAETVLLQQQSIDKFEQVLQTDAFVVVSISPQTRAAIATHFQLNLITAYEKIISFFKRLNVRFVCDTSVAEAISLIEAREEFIHRFRNATSIAWKSPPITVATSSTGVEVYDDPSVNSEIVNPHMVCPMLTSACPGWVCYAEKTTSQAIPYISTAKSPQQVIGNLLKRFWSERFQVLPGNIFHVTVMPCYDKKLEASRKDFFHTDLDTQEVDLVLTTSELMDLIRSKIPEDDFHKLEPENNNIQSEEEAILSGIIYNQQERALYGSVMNEAGSGGYLEHIFRYSAKTLFQIDIPESQPLQYKEGRNKDFREVTLTNNNGEVLLRFAVAYGFRNIQTIINKIRRGNCQYHFVEIMACPSGCINGGGQSTVDRLELKRKVETPAEIKERILNVNQKFHEFIYVPVENNPLAQIVYSIFASEGPFSKTAQELFHTRYHSIPKMAELNPQTIKW